MPYLHGDDMSDVRVTRLRPDDWETLRDVRLAALADAPDAFGSTLAREQAFDEAEWQRRIATSPSFLAWRDGEPVGLVGVLNRAEISGQGSAQGWELVAMWVKSDARGGEAAHLLAAAVIETVRAAQASRLNLWVAEDNARARAFYLRAGFEPTGARQVFRRHDGSEFLEDEMAFDLYR